MNEAVYQAAAHLSQATNPINRRVIVAVTDDASNQLPFMGHSEREATEELFESGSAVSGLLVRHILFTAHYQVDNLIKKGTGRGSIVKYAKKTGGETMSAYERNVAAKLAEVIDRVRMRYSLGYYPTNSEMDGRFRKLKLKVTPQLEAREGKVVVRTRQGYYARKPVRADNENDKQPRPEKKKMTQ